MADSLPPNPFPFLTPSYAGGRNSICRADTPYPSVSQESVPSQIDNLTNALYGSITKTVQNNRVIWNIPCDPNLSSSINGIARNTNEGLLCYIMRALNLTTASGVVTVDGVQTLTNKTLDATCVFLGNATTATLATTATTAINIVGGVAGSLPYQTGVGLTALLPQGTAGQVLSTNGAGSLGWITNSTTSSASNNINGGTAGVVVYQIGVNTTGFTAAGTSGQVLLSNGTSAPTWSTNIAGNAGTATQLQTSRTLGISGDVTGTASFNGSANATIAGTIANNAVTAAKMAQGGKELCKAFVNFNGTTPTPSTIRSPYNVSSITKNGTGDYTVNFSVAMAGPDYTVCGMANASVSNYLTTMNLYSTSTSSCRVKTGRMNVGTGIINPDDNSVVSIQIFGN